MKNNRRDFLRTSALGGFALCAGRVTSYGNNDVAGKKDKIHIPEKQGKSVMGLRCEPLSVVRIAVIGLGRGGSAVYRLARIEGAQVVVIDDVVSERVASSQKSLKEAGRPEAIEYSKEDDWKKICERDDIDLIYTATPWKLHVPIALYAMEHGKHVAVEVPAALTIDDCWALVDTAEKTQRHCMMLENCCYDFFELTTLNMVRHGLLGDIIHGECAYLHDLRYQMEPNDKFHFWRLNYYKEHTGNPYPTHGLGPISQIMGINHGDRMDYLTSMSTNQFGMSLYAEKTYGKDSVQAKTNYKLGDMNTTVVKTVNGKTIMIQHNVTSPRPYDRIHKLNGTKGYAVKYPEPKIALEPDAHEFIDAEKFEGLMGEYEHPLAKYIGQAAKKVGGHGGMDYIMDWRLIYCLRNGYPLDQTVYDAATWSSIVELSERSVLSESKSVKVPDFTRGEWEKANPLPVIDMDKVLYRL